MNLKVENTSVEEIKSFKVTTTFLFTQEQMESNETFTVKQLFDAVTGKEEKVEAAVVEAVAEIQAEDNVTKVIKANINQHPDQILSLVRQSESGRGFTIVDQEVRNKIALIKRG